MKFSAVFQFKEDNGLAKDHRWNGKSLTFNSSLSALIHMCDEAGILCTFKNNKDQEYISKKYLYSISIICCPENLIEISETELNK